MELPIEDAVKILAPYGYTPSEPQDPFERIYDSARCTPHKAIVVIWKSWKQLGVTREDAIQSMLHAQNAGRRYAFWYTYKCEEASKILIDSVKNE